MSRGSIGILDAAATGKDLVDLMLGFEICFIGLVTLLEQRGIVPMREFGTVLKGLAETHPQGMLRTVVETTADSLIRGDGPPALTVITGGKAGDEH
jgi:hypothetical protein